MRHAAPPPLQIAPTTLNDSKKSLQFLRLGTSIIDHKTSFENPPTSTRCEIIDYDSGDVVTHDPIPHPVNWFSPGNWSLVCNRLKLVRKLWQSDSWDEQSQQPAQTKECHGTSCAIPAGFPFFLEISSEASYQNVSTVCYTFLKTAVKSELSRWAAGVLDNPPTAPLCTLWYNTQCGIIHSVSTLLAVQSLHIHSAPGLAAYSRPDYTCSNKNNCFTIPS